MDGNTLVPKSSESSMPTPTGEAHLYGGNNTSPKNTTPSTANTASGEQGGQNVPSSVASNDESISAGDKESKSKKQGKTNDTSENDTKKTTDSSNVLGAATKGAQLVKAAKFVMWFKVKLQMMLQLLRTVSAIQAFVLSVAAVILVFLTSVLALFAGSDDTARKDAYLEDCNVYISKGAIGDSTESIDADKLKLQTAKRIYAVMSYYGMRPEQCFAILGNWEHESGLDPTSVETIFDEYYKIGESKQDAIEWDFVIKHWNPQYARQYPDIDRCGIGLGQWTNERNEKLNHYAYIAGDQNYNGATGDYFQWYDLTLQLAFALDESSVGDNNASWLKSFSEIGEEEFKGDKGSYNKYKNPTYPIEGENGEHEEDDYYDDADRETARIYADEQADIAESNKEFDVKVIDDYTTGAFHWEIDENLYDKFWKNTYRKKLYEETTKRYTAQFMNEWEGINMAYDSRERNALKWFNQWWDSSVSLEPNLDAEDVDNFFKVEEGYASSVLKIADVTKDYKRILGKAYTYDGDMSVCRRYALKNCKDIAQAACMIAHPDRASSEGNNGTNVYKWVHDRVIEGDSVYMSCDRTVCTAVRWSGYDDDYPKGNTLTQIQYLTTSPRWTELDWGGDVNQLLPGDVLIKKDSLESSADTEEAGDVHHTLMYVGNYLAQYYGHSTSDTACIIEGSYGERSPGVGEWSSQYETYHAFRCTNPMEEGKSKYQGVAYIE